MRVNPVMAVAAAGFVIFVMVVPLSGTGPPPSTASPAQGSLVPSAARATPTANPWTRNTVPADAESGGVRGSQVSAPSAPAAHVESDPAGFGPALVCGGPGEVPDAVCAQIAATATEHLVGELAGPDPRTGRPGCCADAVVSGVSVEVVDGAYVVRVAWRSTERADITTVPVFGSDGGGFAVREETS